MTAAARRRAHIRDRSGYCAASIDPIESLSSMSEISNNQVQVLDSLRLDRCPDCGYLLAGLPEEGCCPECGFTYTRDTIVLYGSGRGVSSSTPAGCLWHVMFFVLVVPAFLSVFCRFGLRRMFPWLASVAFSLGVVYMICERWRTRRDGLNPKAQWQLRLTPQGFAEEIFIGPVRLHPWTRDMRIKVTIAGRSACRKMRIRIIKWDWKGPLDLSRELVDFRLTCSEEVAQQIRQKIEMWGIPSLSH